MERFFTILLLVCFCLFGCSSEPPTTLPQSLGEKCKSWDAIAGPSDYLNSPMVTAGDRLYMVGHQDGQFPDLGWHVKGEMGGIWAHPIKLMDGFSVAIQEKEDTEKYCLEAAKQFTIFPFAGQHYFEIPELEVNVWRTQFVPDQLSGLVVEFLIENRESESQTITFDFNGMADLRPVWLGERSGMDDAEDDLQYLTDQEAFHGFDADNDWHVFFGADQTPMTQESGVSSCPTDNAGLGKVGKLSYELSLPGTSKTPITFFIAGSHQGETEAMATYQKLKDNSTSLFDQKATRYQALQNTAVLSIPDPAIQKLYTWTRYNVDWLAFDVPEVGKGIAAGIPDYPWYFGCDQTYTARGLVHSGYPALALDILNTLLDISEKHNGNGRIIHEASTNGIVFNPGNINETPHFIATAWEVYQWTADTDFLNRAYQQAITGLAWLETQDEDGNSYPDGHGMMEIRGMDSEMIDVVAYTQEAYAAAAKMARELDDKERAEAYQEKANQLANKINADWWSAKDQSFADFRSDKAKAEELLRDALVRADTLGKTWSVADLKVVAERMTKIPNTGSQPYAFYHNWVVNTPLETGVADTTYALAALETAKRFRNPFGVYVTGIDRKAEESDPSSFASAKAKETFNYTGAVMTLPTGVQAIASARYGDNEGALDYLQRLSESFSFAAPGSMYEVSPDYGMLVQAWNIYSVATPIVGYFFGIRPDAPDRIIHLAPNLPSDWPEATIEQLPIGDNKFSVTLTQNRIQIEQTKPDWRILLRLPAADYRINGEPAATTGLPDGSIQIEAIGEEITIAKN